MLSLLLQEKRESQRVDCKYQILWQHSIATLVQSFQGDSLLLTTESLGVPSALLIDLTVKPPFVKHLLIHYLFIIIKQCMKYLKYNLNLINKTYLHPLRTSDDSNSISSCHVLTSHPSSNKISPCSVLELPLLSSRIFYPPLHSPKNLQTPFNWR